MTEKRALIRVIIADDHTLFRDGLAMLLKREKTIELIGEAADGQQLLDMARKQKPEVVITDLRMPVMDGVEVIRILGKEQPGLKFIALSTFENEHLVMEVLEAGATGYIIKNAERGEIIDAIHLICKEGYYYCKATSVKLARLINSGAFNPYRPMVSQLFSELEKKIIHLVCQEKTTQEIADILHMAKRTVDGYRADILYKMNVKSPAGVAIYAIRNGIYSLDEL